MSSQPRMTSSARGPVDQPWKTLGATPSRDDAEGNLRLVEDRSPPGCETHIAAEGQLASTTADSPFDLAMVAFGMVRKFSHIS